MKYKTFTPRFFVALSVILVAAVLRLLPHWPNLTPIAAMALFAGTYIDKKQYAFVIPIAAMFVSRREWNHPHWKPYRIANAVVIPEISDNIAGWKGRQRLLQPQVNQ